MNSIQSLKSKTAIVTGASSGIGRSVALLLASHGVRVFIGARRADKLNEVASEIRSAGGDATAIPCDVTNCKEAEHLVETAVKEAGHVDILVNNAGRGHFASIEDTTDAMIYSMFSVNVFSLWYTTRPALRQMKKQGSGHIINIASMAGKVGYPYNSAYVAAKHACVGFTHALRVELAETGINASVICPAGVLTDWANVTEGGPMLPFFSESGRIAKGIAKERNQSLPRVEGVIAPDAVAQKILDCILHPVPEVYTHTGAKEFALLAATEREAAERMQAPIVLAERQVYGRIRGSDPVNE